MKNNTVLPMNIGKSKEKKEKSGRDGDAPIWGCLKSGVGPRVSSSCHLQVTHHLCPKSKVVLQTLPVKIRGKEKNKWVLEKKYHKEEKPQYIKQKKPTTLLACQANLA